MEHDPFQLLTMTPRTAAACCLIFVSLNWSASADAAVRRTPAIHPHVHHAARPISHHVPVDNSGREEKGKASVYSGKFNGRRMANGTAFNPHSDAAASKTLPLGTTARVTNLVNGRTATVTVQDRGPHAVGRIVDVSPGTAEKLGMKKDSVAPVAVAPITVPQPDGGVKHGAGAAVP